MSYNLFKKNNTKSVLDELKEIYKVLLYIENKEALKQETEKYKEIQIFKNFLNRIVLMFNDLEIRINKMEEYLKISQKSNKNLEEYKILYEMDMEKYLENCSIRMDELGNVLHVMHEVHQCDKIKDEKIVAMFLTVLKNTLFLMKDLTKKLEKIKKLVLGFTRENSMKF